ncbi:MAG: hypothetical protein GC164_03730 [Phycisphaera sp.]|nr:hypothetical protein [Phycisphaera sp.]
MRNHRVTAATVLGLLFGLLGNPTLRAGTYTIDPTQRHQTFEGFGTCLAWWVNDEYRSAAWQQAYFQDLGASILRMDMVPYVAYAPDANELANTSITFDGTANDLTKLNFAFDCVATAGQVATTGKNLLGDKFKLIGTVWTPPHWMKTNANINDANSSGGFLTQSADNIQQFAYYVAAYVKGFEATYGVPMYGITIQNEPTLATGNNSCVYTPEQYHDTFLAVSQEFARQGITTKLFGPETVGVDGGSLTAQNMQFVNALQNDPQTAAALDFFSVHGYTANGADPGGNRQQMADYYNLIQGFGKQSWQTESSGFGPNEWKSADGDGARWIARAIHEGLAYANNNAWLYWQMVMEPNLSEDRKRQVLTEMLPDGSVDTTNPKFAAVEHYFHFIRPGAVRIDAGTDNVTGINILAFLNETDHTLTVVILNMGSNDEQVDLNLPADLDLTQFEVYRTDNSQTFAHLAPLVVDNHALSFQMLGDGIVTLHGQYAPVPEPGSCVLIFTGVAALFRRRK